jgi:hypothetical protein
VNCVPDVAGFKKKGALCLAIRVPLLEQAFLFSKPVEYPFLEMDMENRRYKISTIVTNLDWDAQNLITCFYLRCGKCVKAHSIKKSDLTGGK